MKKSGKICAGKFRYFDIAHGVCNVLMARLRGIRMTLAEPRLIDRMIEDLPVTACVDLGAVEVVALLASKTVDQWRYLRIHYGRA